MLNREFVLNLFSFVLAIVLWFFLRVSTDRDVVSQLAILSLEIPIETKGLDKGLMVYDQDYKTVKVTVKGDENIVDSLEPGLVKAHVSLSGLVGSQNPKVMVTTPRQIEVLSVKPESIGLSVDWVDKMMLPVSVESEGKIVKGFEIASAVSDPPILEVQGPKKVLESAYRVVARVPVEHLRQNSVVESSVLKVIDSKGVSLERGVGITKNPSRVVVNLKLRQAILESTVKVDIGALRVEGGPENYTLEVEPESVLIRLKGDQHKPSKILVEALKVEFKSLEKGMRIHLDVPSNIELLSDEYVTVRAHAQAQAEEKDET